MLKNLIFVLDENTSGLGRGVTTLFPSNLNKWPIPYTNKN
jgi:hypothetical protein